MDTTSRPKRPRASSVPSRGRRSRIDEILDRAAQLSATDIRALASAYRGETRAGQQDREEHERAHRRARAIAIAIKRSGRSAEANALQESVSVAVRKAAVREGVAEKRLLGVVGDAELAIGDAALSVLLRDHLSADVVALLREPFDRVTAPPRDVVEDPAP